MTETDGAIVAETLKALDRDRYYATLILGEPQRAGVQALYAANAEIAVTSERVREPMPGEIRLQWWTDLFAGGARGEAGQNPVAAALIETMARYRLAAGPLERLVAARRFDLYQDPMPDVASFEGYAGETVSILIQYAATILNQGEPPQSGDAAGHLGVATALFGHIRAFGFNAARGRIFLPLELFTDAGVTDTHILARKDSPELRAALARCHALAVDHVARARSALRALPHPVRPAFAALATIDTRAPQGDPFAPPAERADWIKILRLAVFAMTP